MYCCAQSYNWTSWNGPRRIAVAFRYVDPASDVLRCNPSAIEPLYLFVYMQTTQFQQQIAILSSNQLTRNYIGILERKSCNPNSQP